MRKLLSVAGAMMIATATFASPASAQGNMMAGGSCGASASAFGWNNVDMSDFPGGGNTVPALFYQINYSNVPAPTTIGVIVRYNDELESQTAVVPFTADSSGGSFEGVLRAATDPEAQGGGTSELRVQAGISNSRNNRDSDGFGRNGRSPGSAGIANGSYTSGQRGGGIEPGEYTFYIYTGSRGDVYNVKDGTVARNAFIADERGYLGKFSCGVSQNGE